mmetsp:Transcript_74891/g.178125  ORF Transcript_74891/g.178125 Transcript_74891/m.178125 type:complete len:267 (+) Transcript_74891:96-896(+)
MGSFHQHPTSGNRNALGAAVRLGCLYMVVAWLGAPTSVFVGQQMQAVGTSNRDHSLLTLEARRPPSAYNLFMKAKLPDKKLQKEASEAGISPMALCSQQWAAASPTIKKKYIAEAEAAKVGFVPDPPKKKSRTSGYGLFMKELSEDEDFMAENPGGTQFIKAASDAWKACDEELKEDYRRQAAELPDPKQPKIKRKKIGTSGYNLFVKEMCQDSDFKASVSPGPELVKAVAAAWRKVDPATKAEYNEQAAKITAAAKEAAAAAAEE